LWFDAWEYERLGPTLALMQRIANEFNTNKTKFGKTMKGILAVSSDIAARITTGLKLQEVHGHFNSVKNILTITDQLRHMIGNNRLIVFIDDLDRCSYENILNVLEAVKMFFNAKGAIFIFAVDITKLELAWLLK
jgi:predicted KAP-like P-loop ATPase